MSRFELKIYCTNPRCDRPENEAGVKNCANCGTPITYRYLWAIESEERPIGSIVGNGRYKVVSPRLWLDLQPGLVPFMPTEIPDDYLPYLHLYDHRLHLPEIYGVAQDGNQATLLLENVPFNSDGTPYPSLTQLFGQSSAVRQLYWLWQMLELWEPMLNWQVASSLLMEENLRVHDWRLRLRNLTSDQTEPQLSDLASLWSGFLPEVRSSIVTPLQEICVQMHDPKTELSTLRKALNQLLLEQAGLLSLGLQAHGITDVGKTRDHNEDTCYPLTNKGIQDDLFPRLAIVCDGIGGHEGGEVASHMAVQGLKPQIRAFLAELAEQPELVEPDLICEQLSAITRVVNNLISAQNDEQDRSDRRRMGTTLMMTLQVPQRVRTSNGTVLSNSHELYLVSVGDSRAYWLTPRSLHQLSIDDDVAVREVRLGRSTYRDALMRPDAGALTQAMGTRDSDSLRPRVQRFILEEDGLLLICSDGLSDMNLIEEHWEEFTDRLRSGETLEESAQKWVDLANEKNGSDNISLVLTQFQVTDPSRKVPFVTPSEEVTAGTDVSIADAAPVPKKKKSKIFLWSFLLILLGGGGGLAAWSMLDPTGFGTIRDRLQTEIQPKIQNLLPKP
jgi:protein phosphatase